MSLSTQADLDDLTSAMLLVVGIVRRMRERAKADPDPGRMPMATSHLMQLAAAIATKLGEPSLIHAPLEHVVSPELASCHADMARVLVLRALADGRIESGARGDA